MATLTLDDTPAGATRSRSPRCASWVDGLHDITAHDAGAHGSSLRRRGPHVLRRPRPLRDSRARPSTRSARCRVCTELIGGLQAVPAAGDRAPSSVSEVTGRCRVVAACDLAVAAGTRACSAARVKIGLFCSTAIVTISRAIGRKRAMQLLRGGETIDAHAPRPTRAGERGPRPQPDLDAPRNSALATRIADARAGRRCVISNQAFYPRIDLPRTRREPDARDDGDQCDGLRRAEEQSAFLAKRDPVSQRRSSSALRRPPLTAKEARVAFPPVCGTSPSRSRISSANTASYSRLLGADPVLDEDEEGGNSTTPSSPSTAAWCSACAATWDAGPRIGLTRPAPTSTMSVSGCPAPPNWGSGRRALDELGIAHSSIKKARLQHRDLLPRPRRHRASSSSSTPAPEPAREHE